MKFLISNYAYPGFVDGLVKQGHEVLGMHGSIDEFNWWQHLINEGKTNEEYDAILRKQIEENKPDVFLCGKGWHFDKFIKPETIEWIRERVGCTVYWSLDDPDFVPMFMQKEMWKGYDVALSCCGGSLKDYESAGMEAHLFWPAWDQKVWKSFEFTEEEKVDFLLVGTPYTITKIQRRDIAAAMVATGLSVDIWGPKTWLQTKPDHFAAGYNMLKEFYKGSFLDRDGLPELFAKAKINFSNHIRKGDMYLNDRVPIVLGAGAFLLLDRQVGFAEYFKDSVVFFDGVIDAAEKAVYYAEHVDERNEIMRNGQKLIMENDTYEHRANRLLEILAKRGMK